MKKWKSWRCHDCNVKEGDLHRPGCDMDVPSLAISLSGANIPMRSYLIESHIF